MEYYNQLMAKARAYFKLARFYKNAGHESWKFFVRQGKALTEQAIEIRKNI